METDWQGRASQLINLIDPERSFRAGEFEAMDNEAWAALVAELRDKAKTDARLELAAQEAKVRQTARDAARAKAAAGEALTGEEARLLVA